MDIFRTPAAEVSTMYIGAFTREIPNHMKDKFNLAGHFMNIINCYFIVMNGKIIANTK